MQQKLTFLLTKYLHNKKIYGIFLQSTLFLDSTVSVISMGLSFGLTLNQKSMTMRIPSSRNMGVKPEPVDPGSEPDTIGVGPQNTRGVSLGSHHGDKTSNYSLIK